MGFGNELRAPHGGIFVLPLVSNPFLYLLAIAIGTVITAALVIVLMSLDKAKTEEIAHARGRRRGRRRLTGSTLHATAGAATMFVAAPAVCRSSPLWLVRCARRPDRSTSDRQNKEPH